jgi:uncharacterized membrane protein
MSHPSQAPHSSFDPAEILAQRRDRIALSLVLAALSALFLLWFRDDPHIVAAYLLFALPPLLLAVFALRGSRQARFWSGVLALFWFAHGVMITWSEPAQRGYGLAETVLAIGIVFASSVGGLRARARKRKAARETSA